MGNSIFYTFENILQVLTIHFIFKWVLDPGSEQFFKINWFCFYKWKNVKTFSFYIAIFWLKLMKQKYIIYSSQLDPDMWIRIFLLCGCRSRKEMIVCWLLSLLILLQGKEHYELLEWSLLYWTHISTFSIHSWSHCHLYHGKNRRKRTALAAGGK